MIRRHMCIEREVVEQHTLFDLPWSHHRISSCLSTGLNQWAFTVSTSAFFNRIGPYRRAALWSLTVASGEQRTFAAEARGRHSARLTQAVISTFVPLIRSSPRLRWRYGRLLGPAPAWLPTKSSECGTPPPS
jgi:hypothetical protein